MKQLHYLKHVFAFLFCLCLLNKIFAQNCKPFSNAIPFIGTSGQLAKKARMMLEKEAAIIRENPSCNIKVTGYCENSKVAQQRSWDRVNAVINYLVNQQGISESRFIFQYGQEGGNCNLVDIESTTEEGPHSVPAPHPNYNNKP